MRFVQEFGLHVMVCVRTDPEYVVRSYAQQLARLHRGDVTILEATVKRSWPSTGSVDYFSQEVLGMTRVFCEVVQTSWRRQIITKFPLLPWLVRHAARSLNRFQARVKNGSGP